jgi:hypothetical protein
MPELPAMTSPRSSPTGLPLPAIRAHRPYTDLVYSPMLELLSFLRVAKKIGRENIFPTVYIGTQA